MKTRERKEEKKDKKKKEKNKRKRKQKKSFKIKFALIRENFLLIFQLLYSLEWGDHPHLINYLDQCVIFQFSYGCIILLQVSLI